MIEKIDRVSVKRFISNLLSQKDIRKLVVHIALIAIVVGHALIIVGNITAFLILPLLAPWYIALPLMSYIGLLTFSKVLDCPMTKLENSMRRRMDLPEIKGFIGHYAIKPLKRTQIRRRKAKEKQTENFDSYGMYK